MSAPQVLPEELRARLAQVPGTSLLGIGDNVLDCYVDEDLAYPGGNALNVAVYATLLLGGRGSFVGILGDDRFAAHLRQVLDEVGVERAMIRTASGRNGMAFVTLDPDGDRRFVGSNRGGVQAGLRLRITPQDVEYAAGFDRVHTSTYSAIDPELGLLAQGSTLSYDFSDHAESEHIAKVGQHLEVGFASGSHLSEVQVETLGQHALSSGIEQMVITLGSRGAVAFGRQGRVSHGVQPVAAVDTLGAGDAFISGYLSALQAGGDLDQCLEVAATSGALACTYRGAFGHPVQAGIEATEQLLPPAGSGGADCQG